jgi:hypothetical protein
MPRRRQPVSPFRYFNSSPEAIRLAVLLYVKYPLLRNVEDLLSERGIADPRLRFGQKQLGERRQLSPSKSYQATARHCRHGTAWSGSGPGGERVIAQ